MIRSACLATRSCGPISAYVSLDRGATWSALSAELPTTFVSDLVVHPREDRLVASHGRGTHVMDVRDLQTGENQRAEGGTYTVVVTANGVTARETVVVTEAPVPVGGLQATGGAENE